ncbi:MAG TPA: hypothetical protein VHB02_04865 [Acidimicrobiales bacterium]|nr:hypothetical protein [Acidimicrobiales bacterium]
MTALLAAQADGATIKELVEQFGVDRTTVLQHLHRHGVRRRVVGPADLDKFRHLQRAGESISAIAAATGFHVSTVRQRLRGLG